jgi:hypothetical protein
MHASTCTLSHGEILGGLEACRWESVAALPNDGGLIPAFQSTPTVSRLVVSGSQ